MFLEAKGKMLLEIFQILCKMWMYFF